MNGLLFSNIAASAAIAAVLLLRKFFKDRLFAKFFVLLWLLVIFRLLLPFEISSGLSLYAPIREPEFEISKTGETLWEEIPKGEFSVSEQNQNDFSESREREFSSEKIFFGIWLSGAVFTGGFFFFKHRFFVKRILADCVPFEDVSTEFSRGKTRFFKSKTLCSPLSFGILRPTVIIPESTLEKQLPFVLLHEHTHIKDRDAVLKALALCALSLNWFNPVVWFMVKYFDMDIERYCDERVLKTLGGEKAFDYANTILDFAERESLSLSFFSAASLCERVTSIMKNENKKSRFFAAGTIFLAVVLIMTACGTVPEPEEKEPVRTGNLSSEKTVSEEEINSEKQAIAEKIDELLQEYVEVQLGDNTVAIVDIESGETAAVVKIDPNTGNVISVNKDPVNIVTEIPGLTEELQGYYGENAPNNYATDTYSLMQVEKIGKISVSGFYFAEGASASILLVPSEETYVSITYGDALRENGLFVETKGDEIIVSVGTPCENIKEAFDLRIYGDFEGAEITIDNLPYDVYVPAPPAEQPEKPEITETKDIGIEFVSPVKDGWLASKFGSYKGHSGIDIGSKTGTGTEIFAVADGTVVKAKLSTTGYGYHIIIDHGSGIQTCYAHCHELFAKVGQKVSAGDVIASMGSTGNSTGIHLHFELRINGEYADPEEYLPKIG